MRKLYPIIMTLISVFGFISWLSDKNLLSTFVLGFSCGLTAATYAVSFYMKDRDEYA